MKATSLRDTFIVKDWVDGKKQKDIAAEYKISKTRVRQILERNRKLLTDGRKLKRYETN